MNDIKKCYLESENRKDLKIKTSLLSIFVMYEIFNGFCEDTIENYVDCNFQFDEFLKNSLQFRMIVKLILCLDDYFVGSLSYQDKFWKLHCM